LLTEAIYRAQRIEKMHKLQHLNYRHEIVRRAWQSVVRRRPTFESWHIVALTFPSNKIWKRLLIQAIQCHRAQTSENKENAM